MLVYCTTASSDGVCYSVCSLMLLMILRMLVGLLLVLVMVLLIVVDAVGLRTVLVYTPSCWSMLSSP